MDMLPHAQPKYLWISAAIGCVMMNLMKNPTERGEREFRSLL